jgi:hypothetical protein
MDKKNKFNKQRDLAEKMAQAKRLREGGDNNSSNTISSSSTTDSSFTSSSLSTAEEIKLRNDRKRFADLLENSLTSSTGIGGNDMDKGFYLTIEQENEVANAVYKGIVRLYEGDPAPIPPFAELLCIQSGEPIGKGGMLRLLPWEGSTNKASMDYLIIITDPRPKSIELRTAMRRITDTLEVSILEKCVIINTDTPAENRRLLKKNFGDKDVKFRIFCDENMEWMREYTALGEKVCWYHVLLLLLLLLYLLLLFVIYLDCSLPEFPPNHSHSQLLFNVQRFSMTMYVLKDGRVEKIARDVDAELLPMVVKNSLRTI